MADRAELASYVVARWGSVVRTLVLLGLSPREADAVALDGLARCAPGFGAAARDEDVDLWVWRELLARRTAAPAAPPDDAVLVADATVADPEERIALLGRTIAALDRLDEPSRHALALALGAGHDPGLAAELAGTPPRFELVPPEDQVTAALAVVPLRADPATAVLALAASRRRRRLRWGLSAAAALVLLLGVGSGIAWLVAPDADQPGLPEGAVRQVPNPVDVPWYGAGVLHLDEVEVTLPQVRMMVEVPDGIVYADRSDRVVLVDQQGALTQLGTTEAGGAIAGSVERGWVGWVDVGSDVPELVVHDTRTGRDVARRSAEPDLTVVAVDQERVYYDVGGEPWSWQVPDGTPEREPGGPLVDVASAVRVSSVGDGALRISQPLFDVEVTLVGKSATLSPDGDYVLVRLDGEVADEARVYRAGDGRREPPHLTQDEVALAAGFGRFHTITYLVGVRAYAPEDGEFVRLSETGPITLRTCDLDLDQCQDVESMANTRGAPVFPR